tara:strand:+ start:146 stop:514 length:369 start_codon:yes stop_codon:yes gene_type:complete
MAEFELAPEEVDILIEALRTWGASNWRAVDKAFATEAYALRDRLMVERRELLAEEASRAHAEALADSDCPDDIVLCDVCGYDIDGDDPAFACHCTPVDPNETDRWPGRSGGLTLEEIVNPKR